MDSINTIEEQALGFWEDDWHCRATAGELDAPAPDEPDHGIPAGLDEMAPGPTLAAILSSIDVDACSGYDRVLVLRAHQRLASHYQAQVYDAMAAVTDHLLVVDEGDVELATAGAIAEVRAALQLTRRAAESEVGLAVDLRQRLPQVWTALASGAIDGRRARVIVDGTCHLPATEARQVAGDILADAPQLTTGQLRARLRRLCLEANPDDAADRYQDAVADRHVRLEANDDGSARLQGLNLPADRAAAAAERIDRLARSLKRVGETRTMDQLRSDVFLDLLEGVDTADRQGRGRVILTTDIGTLAELANHAGELGGYGPVIADIARQVARQQQDQPWEFVVTDPSHPSGRRTGAVRRRPSRQERREVAARSSFCAFPGCRIPAVACDIDHRHDRALGGPDCVSNYDPMCEHDHDNKHKLKWTYVRLPNGDRVWTSKLGHVYRVPSEPP